MLPTGWSGIAALLGVLTPLIGVPLAVITFYLKGLREQQSASRADLEARHHLLDDGLRLVREELAVLRRDYATKEEWLRESMWARARIERLASAATRCAVELERLAAAPVTAERAARAVAAWEQRISEKSGGSTDQERC
jgi:hypothetical protein